MPIVAIEISPHGQPVALSEALVEACSSGVRDGECALAADATVQAAALATVRWSDEAELRVVVEVELRDGPETGVRARTLEFAARDQRLERWRSVGLTIATLVGGKVPKLRAPEADRSPPPAAPRRAPSRKTPRQGKPNTSAEVATPAPQARAPADREPESQRQAPERRTHRLWTSLAALLGPALDGGLRAGARFQVGWRPSDLPLFFSPNVGYALTPENEHGVSARWWSGGISVGWVVPLGASLDLEPRLGARVERLEASATQPSGARRDSGAHTSYGASAGTDLVLRLGTLSPIAELEVYRSDKATEILVAGQPAGTSAATGWAAGLGLRGFLH